MQGHPLISERNVSDQIRTIPQLITALQAALSLEFATISVYLCAQWSIRKDPDRVAAMIHGIASQEMKHLALVGNVLSALGSKPRLCDESFYPVFPVSTLPGGIELERPLTLSPLTFQQVRAFLDIERIEHNGKSAGSISTFYEKIITAIGVLDPKIQASPQIPIRLVVPISTTADAIRCLRLVVEEGEGSSSSPQQEPKDELAFSHYHTLKQIYLQRRLVRTDDTWNFAGERLSFPEVYCFEPEEAMSPLSYRFSLQLKRLLRSLEECWLGGTSINVAEMYALGTLGRQLVVQGIQPPFTWVDEA